MSLSAWLLQHASLSNEPDRPEREEPRGDGEIAVPTRWTLTGQPDWQSGVVLADDPTAADHWDARAWRPEP